mgnify:CR=1 FL=1
MRSLFSLLLLLSFFSACQSQQPDKSVALGAQQFEQYLPLLEGKKVGLVVNQTSMIGSTHLVDTLLALDIDIEKIFAPEHGFRGSAGAGEHIENGTDSKTGLPIISLYGSHKKPTNEDFSGIDVVIFDIQDVGVRFYTYISTMHYVMEACAEQGKKCIVLDRPNPNGYYVAGPVLDTAYQSFVGMHPIPIVHGLTIGELAKMINGEHWLAKGATCDLTVSIMTNYKHSMRYSLPIKPSPNLPNDRSIALYPSLCLLEPTIISIGRGTEFPFQVTGYPDSTYGSFKFKPMPNPGAPYPKHKNKTCYGEDLRNTPTQTGFTLKWLIFYYNKYKDDGFFTSPGFFDKLAGNNMLRKQIEEGKSEEEIKKSWAPELDKYIILRNKYLLYPDE